MLDDPRGYLVALIEQQRKSVGLVRYLVLDPADAPKEQRRARRSLLRFQKQIMEQCGSFAGHLAQFTESMDNDDQASSAEPAEPTPREQVYHLAAGQLEEAIESQRDAAAFLLDSEVDGSYEQQVEALNDMHVAKRIFPQGPGQALVAARTGQAGFISKSQNE